MAYKAETIKRYIEMGKGFMEILEGMNADNLHVCVSYGNDKIGKTMNVSTAPIFACKNCGGCLHFCYDIKACMRFTKNVFFNRIKNLFLARFHRDRFFAEIDAKMSRRKKNKYFRWHVAGDILDMDYFERMIENAKNHPDFTIWTYTKNYSIVNEYVRTHGGSREAAIPSNFSIMFSEWDGMEMDNPYNFPVFAVKLKDGNKNRTAESFDTMFKCPGNCGTCIKAHCGCIAGQDTYNDEH